MGLKYRVVNCRMKGRHCQAVSVAKEGEISSNVVEFDRDP